MVISTSYGAIPKSMRIIAIILGTLVALLIIISMARIWGDSKTYTAYPMAFFTAHKNSKLVIKAQDIETIKEITTTWPQAIVWIDVRASRDRELFILPPTRDIELLNTLRDKQKETPEAPIFTGGRISDYPWEQINEFYKTTPALFEIYKLFPQTRFILNVVDNVSDVHEKVAATLTEEVKPDKRTLIQSDAGILMTSIKGIKPQWAYGTSIPDLVRLLSMDSMFILSTTQFKGDVFVSPLQIKTRPAFNNAILSEIRKRHKPIYLGPINNEEDFLKAQSFNPDGYIFGDAKKVPASLN